MVLDLIQEEVFHIQVEEMVKMLLSKHANNRTRSSLVLGKDFMRRIDNTTIYAEKMYSLNFTVKNKKFGLSLHYNGDNSYLFANSKEVIKFKAKDYEITPYPSCLGGLSKDYALGYMRATGLTGHIFDFSVDYWAIASDKIQGIHKHLMKKNNIE